VLVWPWTGHSLGCRGGGVGRDELGSGMGWVRLWAKQLGSGQGWILWASICAH
jgi:hypothetical protein